MEEITIIDILTTVFAGIAVFISILGFISSNKSNKVSSSALQISKNSSIFQTRPWITIQVIKQKETERYYDIVKDDNTIKWKVTIQIENIGNSPSTDIRIPKTIKLRDNTIIDENHFIALDNIILGQGKKYQYDFQIIAHVNPDDNIDEVLNRYTENDNGVQFTFTVFYKGLQDRDIDYKTKTVYSINADTVAMLSGSEII